MLSKSTAIAAMLAAAASASPINSTRTARRDTASSNDLGYPSGCMTSYNGVKWGWLPDYDGPRPFMQTINADTGKQACTYGWYFQPSQDYSDDQLTSVMSDVIASGAVFVASVMPTQLTWDQVDDTMAANIGASIKKYTDQGVTVWLRFAHEMNYYVESGTYPGPPGAYSNFQAAWQRVHAQCAAIDGCLMFWSPNRSSDLQGEVEPYWPGPNYVDIVGIDWYADDGETFESAYTDFYNTYSAAYDKHFVLGETGTNGDYSVSAKETWLKQVTMADYSNFPNYQGAMWFEYLKGDDFRLIIGQSSDTITETLSVFA